MTCYGFDSLNELKKKIVFVFFFFVVGQVKTWRGK